MSPPTQPHSDDVYVTYQLCMALSITCMLAPEHFAEHFNATKQRRKGNQNVCSTRDKQKTKGRYPLVAVGGVEPVPT